MLEGVRYRGPLNQCPPFNIIYNHTPRIKQRTQLLFPDFLEIDLSLSANYTRLCGDENGDRAVTAPVPDPFE